MSLVVSLLGAALRVNEVIFQPPLPHSVYGQGTAYTLTSGCSMVKAETQQRRATVRAMVLNIFQHLNNIINRFITTACISTHITS